MKNLFRGIAGVLALTVSGYASAVPVTFDLDGLTSSVSLNTYSSAFGAAPVLTLNSDLETMSEELNAGETWTFDFFTIDLPRLGAGDGTVSASLGFDAPSGAGLATGNGGGSFLSAFIFSAGTLTWITQPGTFTLADGTSYSVLFENLKGITFGTSADVRAFLTLNTEPVPEPGTLALLGLGLVGAGLIKRRRAAAAKAA